MANFGDNLPSQLLDCNKLKEAEYCTETVLQARSVLVKTLSRLSPTNHSSCRKTKQTDLSYGIRMSEKLSFVLSQYMHVMERQMGRELYDRKDCFAFNAAW